MTHLIRLHSSDHVGRTHPRFRRIWWIRGGEFQHGVMEDIKPGDLGILPGLNADGTKDLVPVTKVERIQLQPV